MVKRRMEDAGLPNRKRHGLRFLFREKSGTIERAYAALKALVEEATPPDVKRSRQAV